MNHSEMNLCTSTLFGKIWRLSHTAQPHDKLATSSPLPTLAHHVCGLAARKGGDVSRHHLENALPRLEPLPTWLLG